MGAPRKGTSMDAEDLLELARYPLQAVLLADSFATKFRPITLERPKVLLPLVNVPMLNYTLAWLESAGVEEVFVFCCAHSRQVIDYLECSEWNSQENFRVITIQSHDAVSAGDALRLIYGRNVIHGDFVLVSGDTVSNMPLTTALKEHKDRRKRDSNAIMTMVVKQSKSSPVTHQSRLGTKELFMVIDSHTRQLLCYEDKAHLLKGFVSLDNKLPHIQLHNDRQDCYIDICSQEVLSLFIDNFDYQHLRHHFVKGLLADDIMGYKIFIHEIHSSYAARIDNFRSYDTVSKDIVQRWTYPFVPDVNFYGDCISKLKRNGIYLASDVEQSCLSQIGPFTVIGNRTKIGSDCQISNSIIGSGCTIGSNVLIIGSYIWDNVTVEDGCQIKHAIVCDGAIIKSEAVLEPGVILSFKVVVGHEHVVPPYSRVSLLQQPSKQDSDEELEYADKNNETSNSLIVDNVENLMGEISLESSELGHGGIGHIWSIFEDTIEEEWKHSVAPIPSDKLVDINQAVDDDLESCMEDTMGCTSRELKTDCNSNDSDDQYDVEDSKDDFICFGKEVEATFFRAANENISIDDVNLEINSLRLSYNMTSAICAGEIFFAMMKLALKITQTSPGDLCSNVANVVDSWERLLKFYAKEIDDQIEVILKFEEICLESARDLSPYFHKILQILYDKDMLEEDAILTWASEKRDAGESDKAFVTQSQQFIKWLIEAPEEG